MPILFILTAYCFDYILELCKKKFVFVTTTIGLIIFVLLMYGEGLVIVPQTEYYLEYTTPQPDFKTAYGFINENMAESDVIIASYTPMAKYYVGKADYWLEFSISGKTIVRNKSMVYRESYGNAIIVDDVDMLKEITRAGSGWIVIDKLASHRISSSITKYIFSNLTYFPEASSNIDSWSGIKVYGWKAN